MEHRTTKRVLIVEDDKTFLEMLKLRLEINDYEVIAVRDGVEGFELIKKTHPDLIILDLKLPGIYLSSPSGRQKLDKNLGHTICRMIKFDKHLKHIPILILTASDSPQDIQTALHFGADGYLMKHENLELVVAEVDRLTKQPHDMHDANAKKEQHELSDVHA